MPYTDHDRSVFWMVWRENGGAPTHRHFSKEDAQNEASRLALKCPGEVFFVLKATAAVAADIPLIKQVKLNKDPIPF